MPPAAAALQPTFQGHVATTQDALILFEACLQGHLSPVLRRPHDRERSSLIRSGCVFIYEEKASTIKRWTDGVTWSPSRILGNFLVYRELDKPFPPGEKKRAIKKQQRRPSRPEELYSGWSRIASDVESQVIGSLIDSYGFKADGLVKKTMSVMVQGVSHHLVSYYNVHDVIANNFRTPSQTENLQYVRPRPELTSKQISRSAIKEMEEVDGIRDVQGRYGYVVRSQDYVQDHRRPYTIPQYYPPMSQEPAAGYFAGVPSMQPRYLLTAVPRPGTPPQRHDHGHYDQAGYTRSFDFLRSAKSESIPPTQPSIPPIMPGRDQQQPPIHPPPMPMEPRNSSDRLRPYMGSATSPIHGHRSSEPPLVHVQYEDRRELAQQPGQMYEDSRASYYGAGSTPQMYQAPYSQYPS